MAEQTDKKRLILIDGHGLAYRMFYAIHASMTTRAGEPTNATYGFTRMLISMITGSDSPEYLAVSFDVGRTFRDDMFADYKATREKMPDSLRIQIDRIHDVLEAFNVPILEVEGFEADDVLGTVARLAGEMGVEVLIVTGDKDLLQLVNEYTHVQLPGKRSGEDEVYDIQAVRDRFGFDPHKIVDYKALVGDSSDNIPGVSGVGDKSATKLLQAYPDLDAIYSNLESISAARTRNALADKRETAYLSRELARIVTDVPLDFDLESCRTQDYDREQVAEVFRELEFGGLLRQLSPTESEVVAVSPVSGQQLPLFGGEVASASPDITVNIVTETHIIRSAAELGALAAELAKADGIAFDTETTSTDQMQARLVGISLSFKPGEGYYIPVGHALDDEPQLDISTVMDALRPAFTDPDIPKYGHNIKYDAVVMERHGLRVSPLSFDTMIAEWLGRPGASLRRLGLKNLAFTRLGVEMTPIDVLLGTGRNQITMDLVPVRSAAPYAAADADMTLQLVAPVFKDVVEQDLEKLFYTVEMPLVQVLSDMEQAGIRLDVDYLIRMSGELNEALENNTRRIYSIAGGEFNINSPQQLSEVLFEKLRLSTEGLRKTKTGYYSTAAGVLEGLKPQDKSGIIDTILEYRELEKLRSTYVDALPGMVNPETGRVHTSFNQTGTVTGRISSSDPNLQNIPVRSELGRKVRDAFVVAPGNVLIGADYSQVELRVMAHISGDTALQQAFLDDMDIHATTAASVFNIDLDSVTSAQRSFAKAVNFGLLYGMGAFRLARDSELTLAEAEQFISTYFQRFPKVKEYLETTRQQAVEQGYVETLLGRKRYFPIFKATDKSQRTMMERRAAEREAVNMPIQGTAADIIKLAMIDLHRALPEHGLSGRMILQVHDELVLEAPEREVDETVALVREIMENAYTLSVPLKVDSHVGYHWGELK